MTLQASGLVQMQLATTRCQPILTMARIPSHRRRKEVIVWGGELARLRKQKGGGELGVGRRGRRCSEWEEISEALRRQEVWVFALLPLLTPRLHINPFGAPWSTQA